MGFLRSAATTTTAAAVAALTFTSVSAPSSSSSPQNPSFSLPKTLKLQSFSTNKPFDHLGLSKNLTRPPSALHMDAPLSDYKPSSPQVIHFLDQVFFFIYFLLKIKYCIFSFVLMIILIFVDLQNGAVLPDLLVSFDLYVLCNS